MGSRTILREARTRGSSSINRTRFLTTELSTSAPWVLTTMGGKIDAKGRSDPFRALNLNLSSMLPNDLMSDGQSQPRSFVEGARMFGGKKRVKDVVKVVG